MFAREFLQLLKGILSANMVASGANILLTRMWVHSGGLLLLQEPTAQNAIEMGNSGQQNVSCITFKVFIAVC